MAHSDPTPILFVLPSYAGGGAERVALTVAHGLHRRGHRVGLILLEAQGPLANLAHPGIPRFDLKTPRLRAALTGIGGVLRRLGPSRVVSTFGHINLGLAAIKPFLPVGTRLYFREANLPSLSLAAQSGLLVNATTLRLAYRLLYPLAAKVIATSERMADEFHYQLGIARDKLQLLPNPVDSLALRRHAPLRMPGEGLRLVAVGRLTHQKGFDRLLPLLHAMPDNAELSILGDGPMQAALIQQTQQLGLMNRVHFEGFKPDAAAWIAGADALLLPSRWEGMPNVALEALALGTPVLGTPEAGGLAEVAAAAQRGAVTLARFDAEYSAALAALQPQPLADNEGARPSLLPWQYELDRVLDGWEALLA
ncbi:glycosyltransferase [Ferrovibrio sp.]|uniref:glycosyltransferase n=1 Tax=Ferrovibrio sp. TaxID=1917215 RepID=UPI0025BF07B4|nr:glycosyltransferase [Ferrovibrio sp.]MBX3455976.1 glycosyltransferase [Ferrovibrio sp.]